MLIAVRADPLHAQVRALLTEAVWPADLRQWLLQAVEKALIDARLDRRLEEIKALIRRVVPPDALNGLGQADAYPFFYRRVWTRLQAQPLPPFDLAAESAAVVDAFSQAWRQCDEDRHALAALLRLLIKRVLVEDGALVALDLPSGDRWAAEQ